MVYTFQVSPLYPTGHFITEQRNTFNSKLIGLHKRKEEGMSFLEKVSTGLKKAADDGWLIVREGAKAAEEKTKGVAKTGKLKYQVYTLQRRAEKYMTEIGGKVYDMAAAPSENPLSSPVIMSLIESVKEIEGEVKRLESEIEEMKDVSIKSIP